MRASEYVRDILKTKSVFKAESGRLYYLEESGTRIYVKHDLFAACMRAGLVGLKAYKPYEVFITDWGRFIWKMEGEV